MSKKWSKVLISALALSLALSAPAYAGNHGGAKPDRPAKQEKADAHQEHGAHTQDAQAKDAHQGGEHGKEQGGQHEKGPKDTGNRLAAITNLVEEIEETTYELFAEIKEFYQLEDIAEEESTEEGTTEESTTEESTTEESTTEESTTEESTTEESTTEESTTEETTTEETTTEETTTEETTTEETTTEEVDEEAIEEALEDADKELEEAEKQAGKANSFAGKLKAQLNKLNAVSNQLAALAKRSSTEDEQIKALTDRVQKLQTEISAQLEQLDTAISVQKNAVKEDIKDLEAYKKLAKLLKKSGKLGINTFINGEEVQFDVPPLIKNGRTLVPFRNVAKVFNADVIWNQKEKSVTMTRGDVTVQLFIGSSVAIVNGQEVALDQPASIVENRTVIPLAFLSKAFGAKVVWDQETKSIVIYEETTTTDTTTTDTTTTDTTTTDTTTTDTTTTDSTTTQ
jgi:myosin heavy subunit